MFTPESGPLLKATLLELGPNTHVLVLLIHHIVGDHASLSIIFEDLVVGYRARLDGKPPQWATLPIQFVDYALWQRNAFDTDWGQAELAYWRDALAGLPDEISIAPDHTRPPVLGKQGEVVTFRVSAARRGALTQLAEQNGVTEFMVYQAVLALLLYKLGGGTDIPIGCPVASRFESATEKLVGLFANMVVLRNDLSGDPSLRTRDRAKPRRGARRLRAPGAAHRALGRGAQPAALAIPEPAVSEHAPLPRRGLGAGATRPH